ncbi:unnamed protein product [Brugia pahangi]|uniref:ATS domain-containing protein n=1 Tax=Brugia pahangi TaxID=6280 RepID=A0A0N4U075_BRUPA|nr:unnamed protein product [Brugia pahangi]
MAPNYNHTVVSSYSDNMVPKYNDITVMVSQWKLQCGNYNGTVAPNYNDTAVPKYSNATIPNYNDNMVLTTTTPRYTTTMTPWYL